MALEATVIEAARGGEAEALHALDAAISALEPAARVEFALRELPGTHILSSSFGAQAAVSLHLVTRVAPRIPVVLVDTGYLFPETYQFIDTLAERLDLNLHVVQPTLSPSWLEARHGRLWEQGIEGLEQYGQIAKAEPMQRALREQRVGTWISGLRRAQSRSRAQLRCVEVVDGRFKVQPIVDWSDRDVGRYLKQHELPYHPLWDKGYVSIGDWHTTRPLASGQRGGDPLLRLETRVRPARAVRLTPGPGTAMERLPLFLDLRDQPVTVVGGGIVAERKVRLLESAGARITVVAPTLTDTLAARAAAAALRHVPRTFVGSDADAAWLASARLVIAATDDRAINTAVSERARARGIWVNVVDDAELSTALMPSIIDRSPVIVAVSTGGASPVLARRLRERLEALLEPSLGPLAALLARFRQRLIARWPDPSQRRRAVDALLDGGLAPPRALPTSLTRNGPSNGRWPRRRPTVSRPAW
ncbi:MAG: phosphoadenylyl-sulfate reductase [Steroidobacteraceae bacterium]